MIFKSSEEIRFMFLDFFKSKGHHVIKSSSLIPTLNDSSLLFVNSGMNQFKDFFYGFKKPKYNEVVSIQKCLRISGKHNDINNIGYTSRHNTFFEMMGNFSFSSYFKKEAIMYSWELLTSKKWFNIPQNKLVITVNSLDYETYNIWVKDINIPKENIFLVGNNNNIIDSDNFWKISYFGLCGTSTEIFYNFNDKSLKNFHNTKNSSYLEIWNLVFIEYNLNYLNKLEVLPNKSVDTGMGLERIASVLQGVKSNFEIDIFKNLIYLLYNFLGINVSIINKNILYIIIDHIRSIVFLIIDGIVPSSNDRGYILRKLIRRVLLNIKLLSIKKNFELFDLFNVLIDDIIKYEYIKNKEKLLNKIKYFLIKEEKKFLIILNKGLEILNCYLLKLKSGDILNGDLIFKLYDTFGFPLDLIKDVCNSRNINIDLHGFNKNLNIQKNKSRYYSKFNISNFATSIVCCDKTFFYGYLNINKFNTKIISIIVNNDNVNEICINQSGILITKDTIFYPELGGQRSDIGKFISKDKKSVFIVNNVKKNGNYIFHIGYILKGMFKLNDNVILIYDEYNREMLSCNHTCLHILYSSLKLLLGSKIKIKGSSIKKKKITFDFNYFKPLSEKKIFKLEYLVNSIIKKNIFINESFINDKVENNNLNLFYLKENFNRYLRFISIDNFSREKCCGLHVNNTGIINLFFIIKEYSISHGIRRIEAVSSDYAFKYFYKKRLLLNNLSKFLSLNDNFLFNGVKSIIKKFNLLKNKYKDILNIYLENLNYFFSLKECFVYKKIFFLVKDVTFLKISKNILYILLKKLIFRFKLQFILFLRKKDYIINLYFLLNSKFLKEKINIFVKKVVLFFNKENNINFNANKNKNFFYVKLSNNEFINFKLIEFIKYIKLCISGIYF